LVAPVSTDVLALIGSNADGLPFLSFRGTVAKCADPTCSTATFSIPMPTAYATALAKGANGFPVIAWLRTQFSVAPYSVGVVRCGDAACSTGNVSGAIATDRPLPLLSIAMALGADDRPWVAYADYGAGLQNYVVKLAHCGDPTCSSGNTVMTIDPVPTDIGKFVLAVPADGRPILTYAPAPGTIKIARCGDTACSAGRLCWTWH
jgi:hypothetical protein